MYFEIIVGRSPSNAVIYHWECAPCHTRKFHESVPCHICHPLVVVSLMESLLIASSSSWSLMVGLPYCFFAYGVDRSCGFEVEACAFFLSWKNSSGIQLLVLINSTPTLYLKPYVHNATDPSEYLLLYLPPSDSPQYAFFFSYFSWYFSLSYSYMWEFIDPSGNLSWPFLTSCALGLSFCRLTLTPIFFKTVILNHQG